MTEQIVSISFAQGVDEVTRAELVDPSAGSLVALNVEQARNGALSKTTGYELLTSNRLSGMRTVGKRTFAHGAVPAVIDGTKIDLYSDTSAVNIAADNVPPFSMQRDPLFAPKGGFDPDPVSATKTYATAWYDFCIVGDVGVAIYTWYQGTTKTLEWYAWSVSTRIAIGGGSLSTGSVYGAAARGIAAKLVAIGARVYAVYERGAANTITATLLDATSLTTAALGFAGGSADIVTNWAQADFDVCNDGTNIYVVYDQTGGNRLTVNRYSNVFGLSQSSFAATAPAAAIVAVSCDVSSGYIWAHWYEAGGGITYLASISAAATNTTVMARTSALQAGASVGDIFHLGVKLDATGKSGWVSGNADQYAALGTREGLCARQMTENGAWTKGTLRNWPSLGALSQPFAIGANRYMWTFWNASVLSTSGLYNAHRVTAAIALDEALGGDSASLPVAPVVALPAPRLSVYAGASMGSTSALPLHSGQRAYVSGNAAYMMLPRVTSALALVFDWIKLDAADAHCWDTQYMSQASHVAAAVACKFDGSLLTETSFCGRPLMTGSAVAGGLTGTFSYVAIFEHSDANGNVEWSAPSDPLTVTLAGQAARIRYSSLALTRRRNARLVVYRTTNGGTTYYRMLRIDNAPQSSLGTYDDSTTDAIIAVNQRLYGMGALPTTAGATQPRQAPPGLRLLFRHGDRIVGVADDRATLWFSAPMVAGEGRWFSDFFQIPIEATRPIVGACSQDGTILVFTETEIFAISGDGPPDNGGNGSEFSTPQRITSDAGCIEERSLVTTSVGTFFLSARGINLVSKALSIDWIGDKMIATLETYGSVVAATHDQARNMVLFDCVNSSATAGLTLVYDLAQKTWATERRFESADAGSPAVDTCIIRLSNQERHHALKADGSLYRRRLVTDASAYLDTSTWRTMRAATAWFKVAGLSGYGQIKRLELMFSQTTNHDLNISFFYDDSPTAESTITRTSSDIAGCGGRLDIMPARQKCRTFRVTVEDATPSNQGTYPVTTGKGSTFYALALAFDPIGGVARQASTSR